MSSKRGKWKRTKNAYQNNSDDSPSLARSIIDEHSNIVPAGRQLERTPPSKIERVTTHRHPSKPDDSPTSEKEPCGQVNNQTNMHPTEVFNQ